MSCTYLVCVRLFLQVCINAWTYKTVNGNVYGVSGNQWVSVETPESIAVKVSTGKAKIKNVFDQPILELKPKKPRDLFQTAYIKQQGLAGAMINALESDDFNDLCEGGANPLLTAINAGLK